MEKNEMKRDGEKSMNKKSNSSPAERLLLLLRKQTKPQ